MIDIILKNEQATQSLARGLAKRVTSPLIIFLSGDLGAGKTTLVRAFLRHIGVSSAIKSPTYTLVEPYDTSLGSILHFDLYRLSSAEELEYIGIRDYLAEAAVCFFEWPERAAGVLPPPDLTIRLALVDAGRVATIQAHSEPAQAIIEALNI